MREEVTPSQKPFRSMVDVNLLGQAASLGATHVLVGIEWGAMGTITCEDENNDGEEATKVKGALEAELKKLKGVLDLGGSTGAEYEDKSKSTGRKFTYYSKCDVFDKDGNLPTAFEEAVEQAKKLPTILARYNKGKGVPITFSLMPIESLLKRFKVESSINVVFQSLREDSVRHCVQVVESATRLKQKIYDLKTQLNDNKDCIPDDVLTKVEELHNKFSVDETAFREDLQNVLKRARSNEGESSDVDTLVGKYEKEQISEAALQLLQFETWKNKIHQVKEFKNCGITYVGRNGDMDNDVVHTLNQDENAFVINASKDGSDESKSNHFFFRRLQRTYKENPSDKFFWADTDLMSSSRGDKNKIIRFLGGYEVSGDVFKDQGRDSEVPLVDFAHGKPISEIANDRAVLKLICPSSSSCGGACSSKEREWLCRKCKSGLWYSKSQNKVFCMSEDCKKEGEPKDILFRCEDINHGLDFVPHQAAFLNEQLGKLRACDVQNILILGETGVGKSTWINGVANYLLHSSLDSAIEEEPVILIPAKFTYTKDNGEMTDVQVGSDKNESMTEGSSSTQEPKTYSFTVEDKVINLIDTPGIGDTRGQDQDKKNFEKILHHLSHFEDIHAICILLKPNNARMGVVFRFCIQELLASQTQEELTTDQGTHFQS